MLSADELTGITSTVEDSLDQSLILSRDTYTTDTTGHQKLLSTTTSIIACNVIKPTASQLQLYAGKIGSARALVLRAMQTTDIREGDHVSYDSLDWVVNGIMNAASYSVTKHYLMVTVS